MNHINPALTETLCQQMLGGLPTGRNGFPLHARFRYFDADLQRCATDHLSSPNSSAATRTYVKPLERNVTLTTAYRSGIPPGCAALVERLTADTATLSLVNLGGEARKVVVQVLVRFVSLGLYCCFCPTGIVVSILKLIKTGHYCAARAGWCIRGAHNSII